MAGYNRVILIGNLARDPELRYTPQGTAVADLRLAVTEVKGGKGADRKEETLFIDVTVWERQAENCSQYLKKGSPVLVEGRLSIDEWVDKDTQAKRQKPKINASLVRFLGGGSGRSEGGSGEEGAAAPRRRPAAPPPSDAALDEGPTGGDIPF